MRPPTVDDPTYPAAVSVWASVRSLKTSKLKAEKVVNDPSTPIAQN
jgi:hypothetical protein